MLRRGIFSFLKKAVMMCVALGTTEAMITRFTDQSFISVFNVFNESSAVASRRVAIIRFGVVRANLQVVLLRSATNQCSLQEATEGFFFKV